MVYVSQNSDFLGQTSLFPFISHFLPSISIINFGSITFSKGKQYFKPDYLNHLKDGRAECTGNHSNSKKIY